jgi:hypothetical protein
MGRIALVRTRHAEGIARLAHAVAALSPEQAALPGRRWAALSAAYLAARPVCLARGAHPGRPSRATGWLACLALAPRARGHLRLAPGDFEETALWIDALDPRHYRPASAEVAGRALAITGASDGIGRAIALACAQHQGQVILIGRNAPKLEAVHAEILASGAPEPAIAVLDLERALARDFDQLADAVLGATGDWTGFYTTPGSSARSPIEHYDVPPGAA